jgi:hypothetical protein
MQGARKYRVVLERHVCYPSPVRRRRPRDRGLVPVAFDSARPRLCLRALWRTLESLPNGAREVVKVA